MSQIAQEYFTKGVKLCQENKFEDAVAVLSQALVQEAGHLDARYNRAKAYFKLGKLDAAIEDFSVLVNLQPKVAFYYSERGVAYHLAQERVKALADLDKAVELEPEKPFRYASRAFIKDHYGDLKGALSDYEKAIALDPDDAISHNNKGLVEEKLGYKEQSKKSFRKADELDPLYNNQKIEKRGKEVSLPEPESNTEDTPPAASKASKTSVFFGTLKDLVKSSEERKAFITFVKQLGKRK
ncbi:MAG: tetratricopeptide repeat protein [Bacteroidota bacterium]